MQTQSIVVYLEGISDARRFMSTLRSAANASQWWFSRLARGLQVTGGTSPDGAIVGSDDVFDAALRGAGAV